MRLQKYIHVSDAPIYLRDGDTIDGIDFHCTGTTYGRWIFRDHCAIETVGEIKSATISNCTFYMNADEKEPFWMQWKHQWHFARMQYLYLCSFPIEIRRALIRLKFRYMFRKA